MQATAHFETDFMTMVADAKRESMEALGGFCGDAALIVSEAAVDRLHRRHHVRR
jgi:hypothetical protein